MSLQIVLADSLTWIACTPSMPSPLRLPFRRASAQNRLHGHTGTQTKTYPIIGDIATTFYTKYSKAAKSYCLASAQMNTTLLRLVFRPSFSQ